MALSTLTQMQAQIYARPGRILSVSHSARLAVTLDPGKQPLENVDVKIPVIILSPQPLVPRPCIVPLRTSRVILGLATGPRYVQGDVA